VWVVAAIAAAVLAMLSNFDHGPGVGLWLVLALVVGTVFAVFRRRTHVAWLAVGHLLAFVLWTAVDRTTSTAADYYRFWGGSSRRLGDVKTAERAYRRMTEVAPRDGNGFYQLGKLLLAREAGDEGLAALHTAQDLEPLRARSYVAEARWLAAHGRRDEALAKAREGAIVEPTDAEAKALLGSLGAR
jgi:tetratricopeptide (TPR) repeat protein